MRFQAVFLLAIALGVVSSNAFFLEKAKALPEALTSVKLNLVADAKAAVDNLEEAGHLKVKAVKGGIKAVGTAKLGVVKGIKDAKLGVLKGVKAAKIGVLKGIAGAKLAKVAAIKAGKLAFAKTLIAAKLAPVVATAAHVGTLKKAVAAHPLGQSLLQGFKGQNASGSSGSSSASSSAALFSLISGALSSSSSSTSSKPSGILDFATILAQVGGSNNLALYPAPNSAPTHINIVTYKNEATGGQPSGFGNNGYDSRPIVDERSKGFSTPTTAYGAPADQSKFVPSPATSYGTPIAETEKKIVSAPATSYGTPIRAIPPSTSYGAPILQ